MNWPLIVLVVVCIVWLISSAIVLITREVYLRAIDNIEVCCVLKGLPDLKGLKPSEKSQVIKKFLEKKLEKGKRSSKDRKVKELGYDITDMVAQIIIKNT